MAAFDPTSVLITLAIILGFVAGSAIGIGIQAFLRRRRLVAGLVTSGGQGGSALLLKRGVPPLRGAAHILLRISVVDDQLTQVMRILKARGYETDKQATLSLILAGSLLIALVSGLLSASVVCGVALGCCAIAGVWAFVHSRSEKQWNTVRESVPDALRSMGTCFRSGLSLVQTLRHTSQEIGGVLGELFGVAARRLEMGSSVTEALAALRESRRVPELVFVSVALDVQHQTGGSIAPVLDAARESVEDELDLMRSLRVQTAQARLSSRIVTLMPFVLVALFSVMSPDFLTPFFSSALGFALLLLALGMEVAGILVVQRMLRIEVG